MKILEKIAKTDFPFEWVRLDNYIESEAHKTEIYLRDSQCVNDDLINLFYELFEKLQINILVYNNSWWDFTIDTWNFERDTYDYDIKNKSKETVSYLNMLSESGIEKGYMGVCKCIHWREFLQAIIPCITSHKALYSPIFYSEKENFFFYFHHSGSIGLYYKKQTVTIMEVLTKAKQKYLML